MDMKELYEAACRGNVELLNKFLQQNPLVLTDFALTSPTESLLHVATKTGKLNFVRELLKHNFNLATELNKDGFRPIDIASVIGNIEIVREILKIDYNICRLEGKDQRTAIHYAAINGRVEVIEQLVTICPESIKDTTSYGETALHLAVKNNQIEAIIVFLKWIERLGLQQIINWGDCDGNTVLHLAASRKQFKTIQLLLKESDAICEKVEVNATNSKGLTAMDMLDIVLENPNDLQLKEILRRAGALAAQNIIANSLQNVPKTEPTKHKLQSEASKNWFKYFKFQVERDSPSDTRNALLVVAALIATVTFQAGVNPPNGILDSTTKSSSDNSPPPNQSPPPPAYNPAGRVGLTILSESLGYHATFLFFLFANTLGLNASLNIIIYLTEGFPFRRELSISIFSMMFAYGFSIGNISKKDEVVTNIILGVAYILPFSLRWLPMGWRKASKWCTRPRINHRTHLAI